MTAAPLELWEQKQAKHFNALGSAYEAHYSDTYSQHYRARFINQPLLEGLDLTGRQVLEAMCGSGQTTGALLARGARVTGLDISSVLIDSFRQQWPGCDAICASLFDTQIADSSFDAVVVVGGLHHLHPQVDRALDEIHRVLKPGGFFCFGEPHAGSLPDRVRRYWYRCDPLFEKNERAVDLADLQAKNAARFEFVRTKYLGSLAFLLVLNSLIVRVPLAAKRWYAPSLLSLEAALDPWLNRQLACFVACQWQKR